MYRKLREGEGIEMKVCRNPDLKCVFVERIKKRRKINNINGTSGTNPTTTSSSLTTTKRCTVAREWPRR